MHAPDGTVIRGPERRQSPRTVGKPVNGYKMWLRDYLPTDIQGLRILIYGYDSVLKGSTSTNSIQHYALQLLDAVSTIRFEIYEVYK
jgi:hypothetical protein